MTDMTNPHPMQDQLAIDWDNQWPAEPIEGDTLDTVNAVAQGTPTLPDTEWNLFRQAVRFVAASHDGLVDPGHVRACLVDGDGDIIVNPRRLSAFYSRAKAADGFLDFSHWGTNTDSHSKNAGRPQRIYRLRPGATA